MPFCKSNIRYALLTVLLCAGISAQAQSFGPLTFDVNPHIKYVPGDASVPEFFSPYAEYRDTVKVKEGEGVIPLTNIRYRNNGSTPLTIISIANSDPCYCMAEPKTVQPGQYGLLQVKCPVRERTEAASTFLIHTDKTGDKVIVIHLKHIYDVPPVNTPAGMIKTN